MHQRAVGGGDIVLAVQIPFGTGPTLVNFFK